MSWETYTFPNDFNFSKKCKSTKMQNKSKQNSELQNYTCVYAFFCKFHCRWNKGYGPSAVSLCHTVFLELVHCATRRPAERVHQLPWCMKQFEFGFGAPLKGVLEGCINVKSERNDMTHVQIAGGNTKCAHG